MRAEALSKNFQVEDIPFIENLLDRAKNSGNILNGTEELISTDWNPETSPNKQELYHEIKRAQTDAEKLDFLQTLLDSVKNHTNETNYNQGEQEEMENISTILNTLKSLKGIDNLNQVLKILNFLREKYGAEQYAKNNPDFGIMCFNKKLQTNTKFLKAYIELNHENMWFDEWNKIAELNIPKAFQERDVKKLNFFFRLNKKIKNWSETMNTTDHIFAIYFNQAYERDEHFGILSRAKFLAKFKFKELGTLWVDSWRDTLRFRKEKTKILNMPLNEFKQYAENLYQKWDTDAFRKALHNYTFKLTEKGEDVYNELGEDLINKMVENAPLSSLPHVAEYMSKKENIDAGEKIFQKFLKKEGVEVLRFFPKPQFKHLKAVFDFAKGDATKLSTIHEILRSKLAYMNIEDQKDGFLWFTNEHGELPEFVRMIYKSQMSDLQKMDILGQDLFLEKMSKIPDEDIQGIYKKYGKISNIKKLMVKNFVQKSDATKKKIQDQKFNNEKEELKLRRKVKGEYQKIIENMIQDIGIQLNENDPMKQRINKSVEWYIDSDYQRANEVFKTIYNVILDRGGNLTEVQRKKIPIHLEKMIQQITQIKVDKLEKEIQKLTPTLYDFLQSEQNMSKYKSVEMLNQDFKSKVTQIKEEIQKEKLAKKEKNPEVSPEEILEKYLSNEEFKKLPEEKRKAVKEFLKKHQALKNAETEHKTSWVITQNAMGLMSDKKLKEIQNQVMYYGKSVEEAVEIADEKLGKDVENVTQKNTSISKNTLQQEIFTGLSKTPVSLKDLKIKGKTLKWLDAYNLSKDGKDKVTILKGDKPLKTVKSTELMAVLSQDSLIAQMNMWKLIAKASQISTLIAKYTNKEIATQDGNISKFEAENFVDTFGNLIDLPRNSGENIASYITRLRGKYPTENAMNQKLQSLDILDESGIYKHAGLEKALKNQKNTDKVAA